MAVVTEPEAVSSALAERLIETVYALILVVTVGTWVVVGLAVWIPLLVRTTTLLAAAVFYATLFRDQARVSNAQASVHYAVHFYIRGFDHFMAFYRKRHEKQAPVGLFEPLSEMKWKELAIECIWVAGVWALVYVSFHSVKVALFG